MTKTTWDWAEEVQDELGRNLTWTEIHIERGDVNGHALLSGWAMTEHPLYEEHRTRLYSAEQNWVVELIGLDWTPVTDPPNRTYAMRRWLWDNRPAADDVSASELRRYDELDQHADALAAVEAEVAALRAADAEREDLLRKVANGTVDLATLGLGLSIDDLAAAPEGHGRCSIGEGDVYEDEDDDGQVHVVDRRVRCSFLPGHPGRWHREIRDGKVWAEFSGPLSPKEEA